MSQAPTATSATSATNATERPLSPASELLTTAGFKRIDKPSEQYSVQMSISHFEKRLSRPMYMLFSAHFAGDADRVAKHKAEVLKKLEPFWSTPPASKLDWKDADWLRMKGAYIALAAIISKNQSPEAVRPAIAALCEAVSHPAVTPTEAAKARKQLALGKELLGAEVVGLVPGAGLSYDPSEKTMMDAAVLAPTMRKRLRDAGPIAQDCEELKRAKDADVEKEISTWAAATKSEEAMNQEMADIERDEGSHLRDAWASSGDGDLEVIDYNTAQKFDNND